MPWLRIAGAVLVCVLLSVTLRPDRESALTESVTLSHATDGEVRWLDVRAADDDRKAGDNYSVVGQVPLRMEPFRCGETGDQLRFRFDAPAQILGTDISVDIGGPFTLVEVMVAANSERGYGFERAGSPLAHTSWVGWAPGFIDKATVLPSPVELRAGDHLTVGAWLCSDGADAWVSPEVIVHYRWL